MGKHLSKWAASVVGLFGACSGAPPAFSQVAVSASDAEILEFLVPELDDIRLLTMHDLTPEQIDGIGNTPEVARRFEGDFNGDGQQDLALIGSSQDRTVVLIATRDQAVWHRAGLLLPDRPFVVGRLDRGTLRYFFCTSCDSGLRVVWTGAGYELVPFPPIGVQNETNGSGHR